AIDRESEPDTPDVRGKVVGGGEGEGREGVRPSPSLATAESEARGAQPVALTLREGRGTHRGARGRHGDTADHRAWRAGRLRLRLGPPFPLLLLALLLFRISRSATGDHHRATGNAGAEPLEDVAAGRDFADLRRQPIKLNRIHGPTPLSVRQ